MSFTKGPVRIHYEEAGSASVAAHCRRRVELHVSGFRTNHPFNPIDEFKANTAASRPTCATPMRGSPRGRSRSAGRGMRTPMISSA